MAMKSSGLRAEDIDPMVTYGTNPGMGMGISQTVPNPLRFQKPARPGQKAPRADFDATIDKMLASAQKLDASKVKPSDLAAAAAYSGGGGEE